MIYFGQKLKQLRRNKELTQKKLAECMEIKRGLISSYETGSAYPSVENLIRLAEFFNVSTDYLVGMTDDSRFDMSRLTDEEVLSIQEIIRIYTEHHGHSAP